jgi:hypothetical protein
VKYLEHLSGWGVSGGPGDDAERLVGDISLFAYFFSNNLSIEFVIKAGKYSHIEKFPTVESHMALTKKGLAKLI